MAYPTLVGSATGSSVGITTAHTFPSVPSGSAGDLLLAVMVCTGTESLSISGYTSLYIDSSISGTLSIVIAYKTASGSESAPSVTTTNPQASVMMLRRFSGWSAVAICTSDSANDDTAVVHSHTVSGTDDRTWVSVVGAEGDRTGTTTPGLANEVSQATVYLSIFSGTQNTTSGTVSLGSYLMSSFVDWITNSVVITGTGGGGGGNSLTISASLGDIGSYASVLVYPDYTAQLGEFGSSANIYVAYPVSLGELTSQANITTYKLTSRCKVWDGSAWVTAVPKYYDGSSWVEATNIKVYLAGAWVRLS